MKIVTVISSVMTFILLCAVGGFMISESTVVRVSGDEYMVIESLEVLDAEYGEDPSVRVSRNILSPFTGAWTAEISHSDLGHWCSGSGKTNYMTDESIPDTVSLVSWWLFLRTPEQRQMKCVEYPLPVGCYRVVTVWDIVVPAEKRGPTTLVTPVKNVSNQFCVRSTG